MSDGLGGIAKGLTHKLREDEVPLPDDQDLTELLSHYPEEKPICFNYMLAHLDVLHLCGIIRQLRSQIREYVQGNQ